MEEVEEGEEEGEAEEEVGGAAAGVRQKVKQDEHNETLTPHLQPIAFRPSSAPSFSRHAKTFDWPVGENKHKLCDLFCVRCCQVLPGGISPSCFYCDVLIVDISEEEKENSQTSAANLPQSLWNTQ